MASLNGNTDSGVESICSPDSRPRFPVSMKPDEQPSREMGVNKDFQSAIDQSGPQKEPENGFGNSGFVSSDEQGMSPIAQEFPNIDIRSGEALLCDHSFNNLSGISRSCDDDVQVNATTVQQSNTSAAHGSRSRSASHSSHHEYHLHPADDYNHYHPHCPNGTKRSAATSLGTQEASAQLLAESLVLNDEIVQWIKLKLRAHFMNPCQKYKAKGTKPVKMIVQIIKILFVTLQLSLFSQYQFDFRLFIDGNFESFNHLFLHNWQSDYSDPVQRVPNPYAVFHIDDFYQSVNYAVTSYFTLPEKAIGNFSYPTIFSQVETLDSRRKDEHITSIVDFEIPPIKICKAYYNPTKDSDGDSGTVELDPTKVSQCLMIQRSDMDSGKFVLQNWTTQNNFTLDWSSLIDLKISFGLINQHIGSMQTYFKPVCYLFNISIKYDNSRHTGKVSINPSYSESTTECVSITYQYSESGKLYMICITMMDCLIIILASFCLFLCVRSIQLNLHLRTVTRAVWISRFGRPLSKQDDAKFVQWWYVVIIIGDVALIAGSFLKMFITFRVIEDYTVCALMLGCATMVVWIGVLKYLNYFHTYNALLLTLRHSMPNVLRFLVCCLFIYFGFAMAGWAVFGPFHYKFRTFVSTMETMYSLINGDDMFATFAEMRNVSPVVYWFNQIWLYVFIGLFIYCVLSLFIGIITETYDHIRESRDCNREKMTELELFFNDMPEDPSAESFKMLKPSDALICICCLPTDPDSIQDSIVVRARP